MKAVPQMTSPRIQPRAVTLRAYEYTIVYKEGKHHNSADALSRLPLSETSVQDGPEERVLMIESSDITLVSADQVKAWTDEDPVLSRVREMVHKGWPLELKGSEFAPYAVRKNKLSIQNGCVLWSGFATARPRQCFKTASSMPPGSVKNESACQELLYVWWPKLDKGVEDTVKACAIGQDHRNAPAPAPLHPWDWPDKPWSLVQVDYAGPFMGKMFFCAQRCTFQVDGCVSGQLCYFSHDN